MAVLFFRCRISSAHLIYPLQPHLLQPHLPPHTIFTPTSFTSSYLIYPLPPHLPPPTYFMPFHLNYPLSTHLPHPTLFTPSHLIYPLPFLLLLSPFLPLLPHLTIPIPTSGSPPTFPFNRMWYCTASQGTSCEISLVHQEPFDAVILPGGGGGSKKLAQV